MMVQHPMSACSSLALVSSVILDGRPTLLMAAPPVYAAAACRMSCYNSCERWK